MTYRAIVALALIAASMPAAAQARPSGGFNMAGEGAMRSSTGRYGTNRTTTVGGEPGNMTRTTTATNQGATRTSTGSTSAGGYSHSTSTNTAYGSKNSSSGTYNGGVYRSTTATNRYGQSYSGASYAKNGYVYHGATVANPVYRSYGAWGWNGGYAWAPVPYYYGGGFWGPYAAGYATAVAFGYYTTPTQVVINSYQVQPSSPGAKLLSAYGLEQVACGPAGLVVIMGSDNSVICAKPNQLVAAGTYGVDETTLTLTSIAPK